MATVPGVPLIQRRPGVTSQTLEFMWSPPLSDGGSPITSYFLTDGATNNETISADERVFTETKLSNGVAYTFRLAASNAIGLGPYAYFRTVQPGDKPNPPTNVSVSSLFASTTGSYKISWTNPTVVGSTTGLLGNVVKFYPVANNGVVLSNSPSTLRKSVFGASPGSNLQTFVNLSTTFNWLGQVFAVNDPGYSPSNAGFTSTITFLTIQQTNLVYWLDAQSNASYGGSGATWSNLVASNAGCNYTLVGTPTYSTMVYNATSNAALSFSGSGQYMSPNTSQDTFLANGGSNESRELWYYHRGANGVLCSEIGQAGGFHDAHIVVSSTYILMSYWNASLTTYVATSTLTANQWYHIVWMYMASPQSILGFINGQQTLSNLYNRQFPASGYGIHFFRNEATSMGGITNDLNGALAVLRIYNSTLISSQVLNNYNIEKTRFGLV